MIAFLSRLLPLFANNLLPIFLAAGVGYLLGWYFEIDVRALSRVVFYVFSPCLVFNLLTHTRLSGSDLVRMVGFAFAQFAVVGALAWLGGRLLKYERGLFVGVMLAALLPNAGNFGLSLNMFAFGEEALAYASLYFIVSSIVAYTAGVFIASLGKSSLAKSLTGTLKIPTVYAVALALLFGWQGWALPLPLERTAKVLGDAAIPTMLVLLGLQLQRVVWNGSKRGLAFATGMRLVISPLVAVGLSALFGLHGAARQAGILESATPTAVMTTVLATEFEVEPGFVTMAVFTTTLLSPLTITPILALLGG